MLDVTTEGNGCNDIWQLSADFSSGKDRNIEILKYCEKNRKVKQGCSVYHQANHKVLIVDDSFGFAEIAFNLAITLTTLPSTTGTTWKSQRFNNGSKEKKTYTTLYMNELKLWRSYRGTSLNAIEAIAPAV